MTTQQTAQLGIEVTDNGTAEATNAKVGRSLRDLAQKARETGKASGDGLQAMGAGADAAAKSIDKARDSMGRFIGAGKAAGDGLKPLGDGGKEAAEKVDRAAQSLIGSIQRTTAAMEAGSRGSADYYRALASQRGINADALAPYLAQLEAATKRQQELARTAGVSAAQTTAAMRSIPAQMTDIVTQLAGGQNPLLILTQQGGQLKDQFGGVGPALGGVARYILGLVNPATVAGVAVLGLAAAYEKGASQSAEFARNMVLSGNAAGLTEGRFNALAEKVSEASKTTIGSTRETLQALAGSGQITGQVLEQAGTAAQLMARVTGQSAEKLAEKFADAAEYPAKFAAELNKQYSILSAAEMQQIKSMEDQGRTQEALARTFDALNTRLQDAARNFGTLETWWDTLKRKGSEGIDFVLRIGRTSTIDDALKSAQQRLTELRGPTPYKNAPLADAAQYALKGDGFLQQQIKEQEELVARLQVSKQIGDDLAKLQGDRAQGERAIASAFELQNTYKSKQKKIDEEIEAVRRRTAAGLASPTITDAQRTQLQEGLKTAEKEIREKYKDSGAQTSFSDALGAQVEAVKAAEASKLEVIKRAQGQISTLRATGYISEQTQLEESTRLDIEMLNTRKAALREEIGIVEKRKDSKRDVAALERQVAAIDEQIETRRLQGVNAVTEAIYKQAEAWATMGREENAATAYSAAVNADDLRKQVEAQRLANAEIGMSAVTVASLEAAKLREAAATRERTAALMDEMDWSGQLGNQYRQQAASLRELADLKVQGAQLQAGVDAGKQFQQGISTAITQVGQSLSDSLVDGGEDAGKKIAKYFKALAIRTGVEVGLVQPVQSALGIGGTAGGSGGSGLVGTASNAASLYRGATGLTGMLGSGISTVGSWLGSTSMSAYGAGMGLSSAQAAAAAEAYSAAGMAEIGGSITAGSSMAASLAAAAPYVAAALVVANGLGLFKGTEQRDTGLVGTVGDSTSVQQFNLMREDGSLFSGPSYWMEYQQANAPLVAAIQTGIGGMLAVYRAQAATVGQVGALAGFSTTLGSEVVDSDSGAIGISLNGLSGDQALQKIQAELAKIADKAAAQVLGDAGLAFAAAGESASQTLSRLSADITGVNKMLDTLGQSLLQTSISGAGAAARLVDAFGSLDAMSSSVQAYYEAFYSDAERQATSRRQLTAALASVGISALPASKAAYRDLVDAQDLATDSGRKAYAALISLSSVFAEITDAAESAGQSLQDEINRLRGVTGSTDAASLQTQFALQTAAARAGDTVALQSLPDISKALEEASAATASSALDVARMRAWLASSLEQTLHIAVPAFAAGGAHAGGWAVVGEEGPELVDLQPARVYSNGDSRALLDTSRLEAQVQQLTDRVADLDEAVRAAALHTARTVALLKQAMPDGDAIAVRATTD